MYGIDDGDSGNWSSDIINGEYGESIDASNVAPNVDDGGEIGDKKVKWKDWVADDGEDVKVDVSVIMLSLSINIVVMFFIIIL